MNDICVKKNLNYSVEKNDLYFWFHLKCFLAFHTNERQFLYLETCHFISKKKKKKSYFAVR